MSCPDPNCQMCKNNSNREPAVLWTKPNWYVEPETISAKETTWISSSWTKPTIINNLAQAKVEPSEDLQLIIILAAKLLEKGITVEELARRLLTE